VSAEHGFGVERPKRKVAGAECPALAAHRNTRRAEAISLVETLFWRVLAYLSTNALVHPEVRRAADRQLLDVVALAASGRARPESLATVTGHPRWRRRPGGAGRPANPALPGEAAEALLADATRGELAQIAGREEKSPAIRAAAQRVLAQRTQQD
jgi:hypothetical protein